MQLDSQPKDSELLQEKIESDGPESQIVGPELDVEDHEEVSGTNSKFKIPMLERYVRRHDALDQIIGDK